MSIIQGVIASISKGGATPPPPGFEPIDSSVSLGLSWTVETVCDLSPTTFWATMWGNEVWNSALGHLAYLSSTTYLTVGSPNGGNEYNLAQDVSVKSYWAFTHTDGGGLDVYRNGVLLTPSATSYVQPPGISPDNTLLWGARHNNDGTGATDTIGSGNYYWTNISPDVKSALDVATMYDAIRSTYGI